jgi:hypothetical protein
MTFAFGRCNPPTRGHQQLVQTLVRVSHQQGTDAALYLSHTVEPRTDPLSYSEKIRFATLAFGSIVKASNAKTIIEVMKEIETKGYTSVIYVAGQDRVEEFQELLNKYNRNLYHFKDIRVVSAGQRDPDAVGVTGISASKIRGLIAAGDRKAFLDSIPSTLSVADGIRLYYAVRQGMGLSLTESINVMTHQLIGTDGLRKNYEASTPGQSASKNADESFERPPEARWHKILGALSRPMTTG